MEGLADTRLAPKTGGRGSGDHQRLPEAGTISYLDVITAQTELLQAQRGAVQLLGRRLVSSVSLIEALGGGWRDTDLPSRQDVMRNASAPSH